MSLGIIPVIIAVMAVYAIMLSVATLIVPIAGSDEMTVTVDGTVRSVEQHVIANADGTTNSWFSCDVSVSVPAGSAEGDVPESLSVWMPDWYGRPEEGESVSVAYDPSNPASCLAVGMRDAFSSVFDASIRLFGTLLVASIVAIVVLLALGIA